jgi:hypothetical protein
MILASRTAVNCFGAEAVGDRPYAFLAELAHVAHAAVPPGHVVSVGAERPLVPRSTYHDARDGGSTNSFLAEDGHLCSAFLGAKPLARGGLLANAVLDYVGRKGSVGPPEGGRWVR